MAKLFAVHDRLPGLIVAFHDNAEIEGPFAEFTGYVSDLPTLRPTIEVTCITHRNDPILRGTQEGNMPNSDSSP
jgi:UbiD family decarboxylase